jgi:hypothetical protein
MSSRSLLISFPLLRTSHCGLTPDRSGAVFLSLFHDIFILFSRCRGPWGLSASRAATAPSRPPRAPSAARRRLRRGASRQARRTSSGESRTCSRPPPVPPSAPPTVTLNLPLSSTIFHYLPLSPTIFQYLPLSSSIFHSPTTRSSIGTVGGRVGGTGGGVGETEACFAQARGVFTRKDHPLRWAATNLHLAEAYAARVQGEPRRNVEQAIEHCRFCCALSSLGGQPRCVLGLGKRGLGFTECVSARRQ